jgi:putative transcriptional regulator
MINYIPFWQTLKKKNVSSYALIHKHNISNGTLYRMRKGSPISTTTIDQLCKVLDCKVEDIILYTPSEIKS